jgi:tRNA A37 threonylcarbamoyladenosine synthetase subunit TsaC/SUA5/YrdC
VCSSAADTGGQRGEKAIPQRSDEDVYSRHRDRTEAEAGRECQRGKPGEIRRIKSDSRVLRREGSGWFDEGVTRNASGQEQRELSMLRLET